MIPHGAQDNPHGTHDIPHGTEHPDGTQDIPHIYHDMPHGTEHPAVLNTPHGTEYTLYRVMLAKDTDDATSVSLGIFFPYHQKFKWTNRKTFWIVEDISMKRNFSRPIEVFKN